MTDSEMSTGPSVEDLHNRIAELEALGIKAAKE
jgi:hypothetical protein